MEYYKRQLEDALLGYLNDRQLHKNVLILAGARQVGKTTLIEQITQKKPVLLLHLEKEPSIAEHIDRCENFQAFEDYLKEVHRYHPEKQILVIDEAQTSRKLGSFVRFMKEDWEYANVIITGSLVSEIYQETSRTPVGRETHLELWPMSFKEYLFALEQNSLVKALEEYHPLQSFSAEKHERLLEHFNRYLVVGGLPEVVRYALHGKDFQKIRADIYKSYEDDFIRYYSIEEVNLFKRSMEAVASNVGSPSKDSQVIRLDAPGYKKVASIFARLEKWKLIIKCEQLGIEPEKNKFHPKRYLYDVGILGDLRLKGLPFIGLDELHSPMLRTPLGGLIENHVALSLKIQFNDNLFGLRLSSRAEIDFAVKFNHQVYPVECKLSPKLKNNFLIGLKTFESKMGLKGFRGFLLFGGMPKKIDDPKVLVLPYYFADEIKRLLERF
ncbi:MAG: ATP-binding protein [Deltaproteobacteria bacterium]|nr:ATP-binding protein [Deltaproteobacteria bacterium]